MSQSTTRALTTEERALLPQVTLSTLMTIVRQDWPRPYFGAVPYIGALSTINEVSPHGQYFGADDVTGLVNYFLANATTWKGETARTIKAELKRRSAR